MSTNTEELVLAPQSKCQEIAGGVSAMTWSRWARSAPTHPEDAGGNVKSDRPQFPTAFVIKGRKYYSLAELYLWLEAHRGVPTGKIPDAEAGRIKGRAALSVKTSNV